MHMENEKRAKKTLPPYVTYKTFKNFIQGLKVGIPSRIDKSLMSTMAGVIQSQMIATLTFLNLIDVHGKPSDKLVNLVNSEGNERLKILKDILHSSYKPIFIDGFDLNTSTSKHLEEQFVKAGTSGDTTRKCLVFFIGMAKDAEIALSPHILQQKKRGPRGSGKSQNKIRRPSSKNLEERKGEEEPINPNPSMSWNQLLLSKFPSFDPGWPTEVQAKWFDSFEKLMKTEPIVEKEK